jgi:hypothetical protein
MVKPDNRVIAELLQEGMSAGELPFLTISSNSMSPLLRRGDQVGLEAVTHDKLAPGDIVVIRRREALVTHRFWHWTETVDGVQLITRGDRPLSFDPPAPPAALVGRVIARRRQGQMLRLTEGPGHRLHRHLTAVARRESALFAGFSTEAGGADEPPTYLGRHYRQNRRHLPSRLVRFVFYAWRRVLVALASAYVARTPHHQLSAAFVALLLLAAFLFAMPYIAFASVNLSNFYAMPGTADVTLIWITASELDNLGFNLWRGTDCDPLESLKLNETLIASKVGGQATGASYEFVDDDVQPGVVYDYRIESIDSFGTSECHQDFPVQVSLGTGTAIGTPVAGDGTVAPLGTSTTVPTLTPLPSATVAQGSASSTPAPARTSSPTPTSAVAAASDGAPATNDSPPSSLPAEGSTSVGMQTEQPHASATSEQVASTYAGTPAPTEVVAVLPGSAVPPALAESAISADEPELIGGDQPLRAAAETAAERAAGMSAASRTSFFIVLGLSFVVLIGGIVSVIVLVSRSRANNTEESL